MLKRTNRKTFLIRVDGDDNLTGQGHLRRMLSLAHALKNKNCKAIFLSRKTPVAHRCLSLFNVPVRWFPISTPESFIAEETKKWIGKHRYSSFVILDLQRILRKTIRLYRDLGTTLFAMTENSKRSSSKVRTINCHKATGGRYPWALIDPAYKKNRALAAKSRKIESTVKNILISLGGSDPSGGTPKVLNALKKLRLDQKIHVIIPKAYRHQKTFWRCFNSFPHKIRVYHHIKNMASFLKKIDLAIISGGMTRYEAACLGIPAIVITQNKEQESLSKPFCKVTGQIYMGSVKTLSNSQLENQVWKLLDSPRERKKIKTKSLRVVDGEAAKRIATFILANSQMALNRTK